MLTSLTIRKMQIRSTMSYHLVSVRTAFIKERENQCSQGCEVKWEFFALLVGMHKENMGCVCVHDGTLLEYYPAIKKREFLPFMTMWMDLEGIMLSEMSNRGRQMISNCMWNLKKKKNKIKLIETEDRLAVARGRRWRVGEMGEKWLKDINSQV